MAMSTIFNITKTLETGLRATCFVYHSITIVPTICDVIYQTRGRVFPPISKHGEVGWKNEAQLRFLTNFEVFGNRRKPSSRRKGNSYKPERLGLSFRNQCSTRNIVACMMRVWSIVTSVEAFTGL